MRIAYLTEDLGVHDVRLLSRLVQSNHAVFLIPYFFRPGPIALPDGIRNLRGVMVECYDARQLNRVDRVLGFRRLLGRIQPDILHASFVQSGGFLAAMARFHPFLLQTWGSDVLINPHASLYNRLKTWVAIRSSDFVTTPSRHVKDEVVRLGRYPAERVAPYCFPWGVDLSVFRPTRGSTSLRRRLGWASARVVIMNRNFKRVYGIEYFLRALPRVLEKHPETRVILLGDGPLREVLLEIAAEMGLDGYVYFGGTVPNAEMPSYLNSADIYVSTALSDGTSVSLLEAMACALPVIVTDAPSNLEWVKDGSNGFVTPRRDSRVLAHRICELLADESLRKEMGAENLAVAKERADWNHSFRMLEGIYEMLVKSHD